MDEPRQYGTLDGFVNACSEMDPELRIFANEPWMPTSRAVATRELRARGPETEAGRLVAVFGDDVADEVPFFMEVGALQALVKRLRKAGVKHPVLLCERVIESARGTA